MVVIQAVVAEAIAKESIFKQYKLSNMRKTIVILAIGLVCTLRLAAQTDVDALRYSQMMPGGTARSIAMGGAFGALGGDFSCLSMNPAGIGLYRRNEFTFTPSILDMRTNSSYLGTSIDASKYNFNISNIGYIANHPVFGATADGWQNWDFGIGYNRTANFNSSISFTGTNTNSSLLDYFVSQANGSNPGDLGAGGSAFPFDAGLAYQGYLINPMASDSSQYSSVLPNHREIQTMNINTTGSMGEMVISLGGNYGNKLYFGATVGIDFINYHENSTYSETNQNDTIPALNNFNLNRTLNTSGTGINLKLGMIYRANDYIRLGLAVHTPTFYSMHDDYTATITSQFDSSAGNIVTYSPPTATGSFDYNYTSPLRVIGSIALIVGQHGVISGDWEFVDYSSTMFSDNANDFASVNQTIQTKYTQTSNFRIGTEWKFGGISLRGGYAMYGSPYSSNNPPPNGADLTTTNYSLGIGVKDMGLSIDFGYIYSMAKEYYQPYALTGENVEGATIKTTNNIFVMTIGYRF